MSSSIMGPVLPPEEKKEAGPSTRVGPLRVGALPGGKPVRPIAEAAKKGQIAEAAKKEEYVHLEKTSRQKLELGSEIIGRIEDAVREGLVGTDWKVRPESYITIRMKMADLSLKTKEDLQRKREKPVARVGGSFNEVFIESPSYVIKAEGSQSTKKTMIAMERFSYDMAHFLGLEESVLPTIKVKLTESQAKSLHLTQELQHQVEEKGEIEVSLAKYTQFKSVEDSDSLKIVDHDSFQIAGLFSGVTQQTDHHTGNGGLVFDPDTKKYKFILFDNDICMQESNTLVKKGDALAVPIRSFFTGFPLADEPLSPRVREIVSKWDEASVRKFCELQKPLLTEGQIKAMCQRINKVRQLVESNPACTLNQCFEEMYPFLKIYKELYLKEYPDPLYTSTAQLDSVTNTFSPMGYYVSLSQLVEDAKDHGKITQEVYNEIKAKMAAYLAVGDFQDITPKTEQKL